jgi:dihydroorotase
MHSSEMSWLVIYLLKKPQVWQKKYSADLHVLHLTTEREIELFEAKPTKDKKITTEACIHHLIFTSDDYEEWGNFIKCNPSIKAPNNREALRQALKNNQIDIIATDHAPHTRDEKSLPYSEAPAGIPLIQHSFQLMLELANKGIFTIEEVIKFASHNTADRFKIVDRGYVREGYFADLVVFETGIKQTVTNEEQKSKCGWTPFEGWELSSKVNSTIVNGDVLLEDRELHPERKSSERLVFNK